VFCNKPAAILQHLRNISGTRLCFLQLSVPLPVGKDQDVSVLLKVSLPAGWSQRSADIQQSAEDMDLTTGKWNTEETCKIFFFVYLILASPKNASCFFYIFDARSIKPAVAMRMSSSSFFIFLEATLDVLLQCSCPLTVDRQNTEMSRKRQHFVGCVCVDSSFTFVSLPFLFCVCSVFVSLMWTWPYS
jgi:hypothetical protein